jgi:serine/threonine-protein kinase
VRTRIGPFLIESTLGEGGMGVVYAARDERLGRLVALKTIRPAAGDAEARERLRREARAAASVNHPNVCGIYEVGEADGELYVAMEHLVGETLAERLGRGALPLPEAAAVARDVLAALEAMHARGIVHRDLKPGNVFLTPHGAKVLDFGLALPMEGPLAQPADRITLPGAVLGTPGYMAPEQFTGEDVGPTADRCSTSTTRSRTRRPRRSRAGPARWRWTAWWRAR